jgi:hypothetical protein
VRVARDERHVPPRRRDESRVGEPERERKADDLERGVVAAIPDERLRGAEREGVGGTGPWHAGTVVTGPAGVLHRRPQAGLLDADHSGTNRS